MSSNCYYCGGHPDEVIDLRRRRDEFEAEIERLRKGIQNFLDGNYTNPRSFRGQGPNVMCPHCRYYYEDCASCDSEHFQKLLNFPQD